jgi:prepilin-type N-terminal cleavage/methylation domain-containing protein
VKVLRSFALAFVPDRTVGADGCPARWAAGPRPSAIAGAFTLIELLVVISIMGLIAAMAVPSLKNLGQSNIQASASRQLLDDVGRARQLAISQHTTVYMIFVRTNFWAMPTIGNTWWNSLTAPQREVATNLCDKQLTGYTFVSLRSVGDQPGQGKCRYLAPWQSLPDGTFIAQQKFQINPNVYYPIYGNNVTYPIYGFNITNTIPFPTQDSPFGLIAGIAPFNFRLPFIAFNYLGQLTFDGLNTAARDEYIPLSEGTVVPATDPTTKTPFISDGTIPTIVEFPPGNSSNSMYHIIHIDHLTGRATLEFQQVQ